ncbi:MAG: T9SS type A sorting domain-containing protein, partial [Bacteroidota bacterium]
AFDLAVLAGARETGQLGAGTLDFQLFHGATDAPAVDVLAGQFPLISNIAYKSFLPDYIGATAGTINLSVAPTGTNNVVATFEVDISGLGGGAAVGFASGFLDPLNNQGGANFALLAALPDGTVVSFPEVREEIVVSDNTGDGTTTWTNDNIYVLDGFVFVEAGDTLIIEPGTVIKGRTGQGAQASALIVARDGYIDAQGTSADPIIFTSIVDDTNNPNDIPLNTTGLWGGVIILGNATLNSEPGETAIEGIPTTETRGLYGGDDDEDNSGIFRYVSIRHGSTNIGAGNEINGLTMGGVGSGTTIEWVEVFNSADDGFEWFGGTVGTKYLISAFNNDDAFDYDEGWRGNNQFWFAIQSSDVGSDFGGEHDGGTSPETAMPFATPVVYNATFIGGGQAEDDEGVFLIRDNAGGEYHNSIFTEYNKGVSVEKLSSGEHSFNRLLDGDLKLHNNIFWNVASDDASIFFVAGSGAEEADQIFIQTYFGDNGNTADGDPAIAGISRTNDGGLDPRAQAGIATTPDSISVVPEGLMSVPYKGAFGTENWARGWTYLEERGFFADLYVSIDDNLSPEEKAVSIFPNPANATFTVSIEDVTRSAEVEMFNINGQRVFARNANAVNSTVDMTINVSTLPAGLYFVRVNTQEAVITKTVIVE